MYLLQKYLNTNPSFLKQYYLIYLNTIHNIYIYILHVLCIIITNAYFKTQLIFIKIIPMIKQYDIDKNCIHSTLL